MPQRLTVVLAIAVVVVVGGTAIAQTAQRFSDVPSDHEAHEAVEWAASVGLTVGYGDGTFGPDDPLSRWQAVTFMERYYDDILQASESDRFTRGDMMMLLKAIDDGDSTASSTGPEPESESGRWLPRPEGRTADGRCGHRVGDTDYYAWEDCAWDTYNDPALRRAEMQALAARVWAETLARGKPAEPPALVEGQCTERRAAACYLPPTHTISIESGVTLRSLLHELAHALITGDPLMADCYADWTHVVPHCAHGPLFRCAADALYVRHADLDPAGVCGAVPDTGDWTVSSSASLAGAYTEWNVNDGTRVFPVHLVIRCTAGTQLRVWFQRGDDWLLGPNGVALVDYRFGGQSQPKRTAAGDSAHNGDHWILEKPAGFLADMSADATGRLHVGLVSTNVSRSGGTRWGDGTPTTDAEATLRTTGYRIHVQPFVDACN